MATGAGLRKRLHRSTKRPSDKGSKRFHDGSSVEASENIPSTPTELASSTDFDKLSAAVGGLLLTDTPKSRPGPKLGITGKRMEGKVLFPDKGPSTKELPNWSDEELRMLTCFLMLYTDGKTWVAHKDNRFWDRAGVFIQQQLHTPHCRSGMM